MVAAIAGVICFSSCGKSSSSGKPVLKLKKVSSYEVQQRGYLTITIECENIGDLKTDQRDTALGVKLLVTNAAGCVFTGGVKTRTESYALPEVASNASGEIELNWGNNISIADLPYGFATLPNTNCRPVDSTVFKFWVKNKDGVVSDTLTIDQPIIVYH